MKIINFKNNLTHRCIVGCQIGIIYLILSEKYYLILTHVKKLVKKLPNIANTLNVKKHVMLWKNLSDMKKFSSFGCTSKKLNLINIAINNYFMLNCIINEC